jgi:hypothetical protein
MSRQPGRRRAGARIPAAEHMDALCFGALRSLAENPDASPQTLALLSHDPLVDVQVAVAWNPRTPASALARLAQGSLEVQAGVAQNPSAGPGLLEQLAGHAEPVVRSAAATNPHLPLLLLHRLAQDQEPRVRRHLARNPRTPYGVLAALAQDADDDVRSTAEGRLREWEP